MVADGAGVAVRAIRRVRSVETSAPGDAGVISARVAVITARLPPSDALTQRTDISSCTGVVVVTRLLVEHIHTARR